MRIRMFEEFGWDRWFTQVSRNEFMQKEEEILATIASGDFEQLSSTQNEKLKEFLKPLFKTIESKSEGHPLTSTLYFDILDYQDLQNGKMVSQSYHFVDADFKWTGAIASMHQSQIEILLENRIYIQIYIDKDDWFWVRNFYGNGGEFFKADQFIGLLKLLEYILNFYLGRN